MGNKKLFSISITMLLIFLGLTHIGVNDVEGDDLPDLTFQWDRFPIPKSDTTSPVKIWKTNPDPQTDVWWIQFTMRNTGTEPVPSGFYVQIILSGDPENYPILTEDVGPWPETIMAQGSSNFESMITLPDTDEHFGADYTCGYAFLDSTTWIDELDETNNKAWSNIWLFQLTGGEMVEQTVYQTNPETYPICLYNTYENAPEGWSIEVSPTYLDIDPGEQEPMYINITAPQNISEYPTFITHSEPQNMTGPWDEPFYLITDPEYW